MKSWMILATSVVVLWAPGLLRSQSPVATDPASVEAEVHRKYLRLETLMGRLLAALKDPGTKKGVLNRALLRSRELRIADRLESVKRLLEKKAFRDALGEEEILDRDIERVLAVLRGEDALEGLRRRDQELDKAQEELERMMRLVEEEQKILEETAKEADGAQKDSAKRKELADRQRELQKKADELRRALDRRLGRDPQQRGGKKSAASDQDSQKDESGSKDEQGKDEKGDQKDQADQDAGSKEAGSPEGQKSDGQKGGGKKSGSKSGKKGGQKSGQKQAGGKQGEQSDSGKEADSGKEEDEEGEEQLERMARTASEEARQAMRKAAQRMSGATQRLDSENMEGAEEDQREALEHLQQAQEALEEEQANKEEERQRALAAALTGKLQAMLSESKLVRAETEALHQKTPPPLPPPETPSAAPAPSELKVEPEKKPAEPLKPPPQSPAESLPERTRRAEARDLGRRERAVVSDADEVLKILEEDGSSDVAPPIITRVKEDLENAGGLLDRGETGALTQAVQTEIEGTLAELIDALAPARRGGRRGGPRDPSSVAEMAPPGAGQTAGAQRKPKLINPIQEIRMLASSQRRVRGRTEKIESLSEGERASQTAKAAEAEKSLESLARKVIERNPLIDPFILGEGDSPEKDEGDETSPKPGGDVRKEGGGDATKN